MTLNEILTKVFIKTITDIGIQVYGEIPSFKFDDQLKQLIFNATKEYFQTYSDRYGQIQVLGMSKPISLDAIYSGARMLDTLSMKSYDSPEALEEAYRNRGDRRFRQNDCSKKNGIDIANESERLIVLGDPGIGKSTFLRKVGLEALRGEQGSYKHKKIPVFLELKLLTSPELDLEACIAAEFETCGFPSSKNFTNEALKKGRLLLLFDGLDEVPASNLDIVIQKIQALVDRYSKNRFIASCRIAAYHTYFKRVITVAIAEFDDDQIEKIITNWFSSELDQQSQTAQQFWKQLQKPENKGAKELAQSPLLLTFLCMVYNKSLTVTSSRSTLYGKALDILLEEWASEKRVGRGEIYEGFHSVLEKELLAKIAYDGFRNNQLFFLKDQLMDQIIGFLQGTLGAPPNLNASAVLNAIELQQGILVERATNVYSFSHLTIQEYLAAKYILNRWDLLNDVVQFYSTDARWREVFLLIAGLMGGAAIGLLEKLDLQTQELSEHPKVKGLLAWVKAKTSSATGDYSGEIKRVFILILIFDLALSRDLSRDLSRARARAYDLSRVRALVRALASNNISTNASNNASARELSRDRAQFALDEQLITDVDLQPLILYLDHSLESSKSSAKELTSIISSSLDISPELFDLSKDDVQAFTSYLSTCQLMVDCSKQAGGLSAQQWEAIKQRMFLPKPANE